MTDSEQSSNKAAALEYKGQKTPIVSALGTDTVADEIVALAKKHDVPIYKDEDLVNILTRLNSGQDIPPALYEWVAGILAFSFFLRDTVPDGFSPTATRSAYQKVREAYSGSDAGE
jgi:flagellar biosynthesis protein